MEHRFTVHFSGRRSDHHRLAANDLASAYSGARRILAAIGYGYCYGEVPRNKFDNTDLFKLEAGPAREGSIIIDLFIELAGSLIYDMAKLGFTLYAIDSFTAWRDGRLFVPPEYTRIEPTLSGAARHNAPFVDQSAYDAWLWKNMTHQFEAGTAEVTRSIGQRSSSAEFFMDGQPMGRFDHRHQTLEESIDLALAPIRDKYWQNKHV